MGPQHLHFVEMGPTCTKKLAPWYPGFGQQRWIERLGERGLVEQALLANHLRNRLLLAQSGLPL